MEYHIHVARGDGKQRSSPRYQKYCYITDNPHTTLVQALEYIQAKLDHSLLFRRSCFHGSCGTCGVILNGKKVLACLIRLSDLPEQEIFVDPLGTFPVIGDLAVDPAGLYAQLPKERQYLRRTNDQPGGNHTGDGLTTDDGFIADSADAAPAAGRNSMTGADTKQLEHCIECGLCESACPVTKPFLGPAALAAYYRELINRPERREEILTRVGKPDGIAPCESSYACSKVCPAGVYPSGKIVKLRKELEGGK